MKRRRWRRIAVCSVLALALFAVASARLFLWPATDRPTTADAIFVLGGDGYRFEEGQALAQQGVAQTLVVAIDKMPGSPCSQDPVALGLQSVELVCFTPDPFTTRGEARYLADLSTERGWHHVIVVTGVAQDTRARIRIDRCWHGDLDLITVRPDAKRLIRDVIYEWGALAKALIAERSC